MELITDYLVNFNLNKDFSNGINLFATADFNESKTQIEYLCLENKNIK